MMTDHVTPQSSRMARASTPLSLYAPVIFQGMLAFVALLTIAVMPVRSGPMLVVPIGEIAAKPWLDRQQGVTILGIGKLRGSMIVAADRNRLFTTALAHHAILLPALPALCGRFDPIRKI